MLMIEHGVLILATVIVFVSALTFVFHPDYDAGFFGTIGLGCLAIASAARFAVVVTGEGPSASPYSLLIWCGLSLYFGSRLGSFLVRSKKKGPTWYESPHRRRVF